MDQDAFRALLSTPRPGGALNSSSRDGGSKFGSLPPKKSSGLGGDTSAEFKKPVFKPRDKGKGKSTKKKEGDDTEAKNSTYRDRAAERRLGKDGDFAGAEKLLEDFKARAEGIEDKSLLEEQMKYLGGDAEHSVFVKGLDMALLERMKYEQSRESDKTIEQVEDELDRVFLAEPVKSKKRTRDEVLAELKAGKGLVLPSLPLDDVDSLERAKAAGRFKPIAKLSQASSKPKKDGVASGPKKKRKKVKAESEGNMAPPPLSSTSTSQNLLPTLTRPSEPTFDADADIFGDAVPYEGMDSDDSDSDSDSEKSARPPPPPPSLPPTTAKPRYFDDEEEEDLQPSSTAPSSVTNLSNPAVNTDGIRSKPLTGNEEEEEEPIPMKLQPLSGSSVPSVRDLLDMDAAAEKAEKRKAKKLNDKDKKEKNMTEDDRANQDYQKMNAYLEKKKGEK